MFKKATQLGRCQRLKRVSGQQAAGAAHVHAVLPVAKGRLILVQKKGMEDREELTDP